MRTKKSSPNCGSGRQRPSFTLVELLISVSMVAILSATALFTLYGVQEHARIARTRSLISRIDELIMERWESFLTRPVPMQILPGDTLSIAAGKRLNGIRELMRVHLPDRKSDVVDNTTVLGQPGKTVFTPLLVSQHLAYRRKASRMVLAAKGTDWLDNTDGWTRAHQGAECLYLILSAIRDGDSSAIDYFLESEIGDVDGDGMREILDGWGRPIEFLRWAPGFVTDPGPDGGWGVAGTDDDGINGIDDEGEAGFPWTDDRSELQSRLAVESPDPFDPRNVDPRDTFALRPLIYSSGPDGVYDIASDFGSGAVRYALTTPYANDPYLVESGTNIQMGRPVDADDPNNTGTPDGILQCWDNITNHLLETR